MENKAVSTALDLKEPSKDAFLESMVLQANVYGESFGITLFVHGSIITGTLIGGREYFQELSKFLTPIDNQTDENPLQYMIDLYPVLPRDADITDLMDTIDVSYIHMKNARVLSGVGMQIGDGQYWRGRLGSVDGFIFGEVVNARAAQ